MGKVLEPAVAILIVVEIVILALGVVFRYVIHNSLAWTDELAAILFLWLTMFGAALAFRRGSHMRLDILVRLAPPRTRAVLDVLATLVPALFCAILIPATVTFLQQEQIIVTAALQLPHSYVDASIVIGLAFILLLAVVRLVDADPRALAVAVGAVAVAIAALMLAHGTLLVLGNANLFIFFVVIVALTVAAGIPIAFCFGIATLGYLSFSTVVPLSTVVSRMDQGISNLVLLTVPLFVLLGLLIDAGGIARRLIDAIAALVGHYRGGLNIVLVGAMYLVSGISGAKAADMAAVAPALFPQMERRGHRREEMIALLTTSGAMAETIPPSLVLIIIGTVVGLSIQDLFVAGLFPALVASAALIAVALVQSRHDGVELAARPPLRAILRAFLIAVPGLVLPFLIRFFVIAGVTTATEVSTIGIVYTLLIGALVYRELDWRRLYPMLLETGALSGAILLIIATATAMGWGLTQSGFAQQLADGVANIGGGRAGFLAAAILLFIILGSVLEGVPAIVLFGPLLFPAAIRIGIHPIHFAIVAVLAMGVGLFAPPFGVGFYTACAIGRARPDAVAGRVAPYIIALIVALIIVASLPWLSIGFLK